MSQPRAGARGPYRPGEETRRKLLDAALRRFGRDGYEATSTRAVCADSAVALPAIAYHFGSKEGLYLACADDVVDRYRARMGVALARMDGALALMTPDDARRALSDVLRLLLDMLRHAGEDEPWLAFMLGEMPRSGPAHARLSRELWSPGLALVARLIGRARAATIDPAADRVDALLLLSSLSALTTARRVTLEFTDVAAIDDLWQAFEASLQRWIAQL